MSYTYPDSGGADLSFAGATTYTPSADLSFETSDGAVTPPTEYEYPVGGVTFTFDGATPYTPSAAFAFTAPTPPGAEYEYPTDGVTFTFAGAQPYTPSTNFAFPTPTAAGGPISARARGIEAGIGAPRYTLLFLTTALPSPRFGRGIASAGPIITVRPAPLVRSAQGFAATRFGTATTLAPATAMVTGFSAAAAGRPIAEITYAAAGFAAALGTPVLALAARAKSIAPSWGRATAGTAHATRYSPAARAGRHTSYAQVIASAATLGALADFGIPGVSTSHKALPTFQPARFGQPTRVLNPC